MTITHFHEDTPLRVRDELLWVQAHDRRIRIFYGDAKTGEAWPQEYDVLGRVGNTNGAEKHALLVHNRRSLGGDIIPDHCIVAIYDIKTGGALYKHPDFTPGDWRVEKVRDTAENYPYAALHNGKEHAAFSTEKQAWRYCEFMTANRFSK